MTDGNSKPQTLGIGDENKGHCDFKFSEMTASLLSVQAKLEALEARINYQAEQIQSTKEILEQLMSNLGGTQGHHQIVTHDANLAAELMKR
jgi:hypothetical protein